MPSVDSNSSYSSSDSSTSPLSSPRALLADLMQQQQHIAPAISSSSSSSYHHHHRPMKSNMPSSPAILPSHSCVTRYKTELCRPFTETGKCKYGDKCQFSHGMKELRVVSRHPKYKTEYCRTFHTTGYCPYGPRCHFIHDVHENRATSSSSSNDFLVRRHSDQRPYSSAPKSASRNRIYSDYTTPTSSSSSSQSKTTADATAFPFTFEELTEALLSFETDEIFSSQYQQAQQQAQQQQQQQQQHQEAFSPSRLSAMADALTYRAFSSSSSSNSSLAPQYI